MHVADKQLLCIPWSLPILGTCFPVLCQHCLLCLRGDLCRSTGGRFAAHLTMLTLAV